MRDCHGDGYIPDLQPHLLTSEDSCSCHGYYYAFGCCSGLCCCAVCDCRVVAVDDVVGGGVVVLLLAAVVWEVLAVDCCAAVDNACLTVHHGHC